MFDSRSLPSLSRRRRRGFGAGRSFPTSAVSCSTAYPWSASHVCTDAMTCTAACSSRAAYFERSPSYSAKTRGSSPPSAFGTSRYSRARSVVDAHGGRDGQWTGHGEARELPCTGVAHREVERLEPGDAKAAARGERHGGGVARRNLDRRTRPRARFDLHESG